MPTRSKLLALCGVLATTAAVVRCATTEDIEDTANSNEYVVNRLWIERMPHDERDIVGHLLFFDQPGAMHRIGSVGRSSRWHHEVDLFKWALEHDVLSVVFPQTRIKGRLKARSWRCKGEAPKPFELCLELSAGDRRVVYYSRDDWEVRPQDAELEAVDVLPGTSATVERTLRAATARASSETVAADERDAGEVLARFAGKANDSPQ